MIIKEEVLEELRSCKFYKFKKNRWWYKGPLSMENMPPLAMRAHIIWQNEGGRCNNSNHPMYCYYGAKGVERIWTSRQCINFYINALLKKKKWKNPHISRNNDEGNYEKGNCQLKEASQNISEKKWTKKGRKGVSDAMKRNKTYLLGQEAAKKKVKLVNLEDKSDVLNFNSATDASFALGYKNQATVSIYIKNNYPLKFKGNKYKATYI